MFDLTARRQGKSLLMIEQIKFALATKQKLVIACHDQQKMISLLHYHFPKALFELVDDCGIIVWNRN